MEDNQICRICYDEDDLNNLISPCDCCGTLKFVHYDCLDLWLQVSHKSTCDLCKSSYEIEWHFKPLTEWPIYCREVILVCMLIVQFIFIWCISDWFELYYRTMMMLPNSITAYRLMQEWFNKISIIRFKNKCCNRKNGADKEKSSTDLKL